MKQLGQCMKYLPKLQNFLLDLGDNNLGWREENVKYLGEGIK